MLSIPHHKISKTKILLVNIGNIAPHSGEERDFYIVQVDEFLLLKNIYLEMLVQTAATTVRDRRIFVETIIAGDVTRIFSIVSQSNVLSFPSVGSFSGDILLSPGDRLLVGTSDGSIAGTSQYGAALLAYILK